ncbi:serine/threonine-protein kinase [Actinomadura sp. WMMB 499]|uniref:serine/threonine-protein kinase n=1 Tax=Actinomadura sp. WMMB 499 TaxID=1219491 RepID=UPI001246D647|nr:serine/threonine-protein kinase [Actinomadura sp. WMMB 499]QFG23486.1 protein kinase [Actinomadura sp. WMMB 499]
MDDLQTGDPRSVGGYRLLGRLGSGGMGSVFLGRSPSGRTVAVKFVHAELARDAGFRRRFRQEVEAARRVSGPWTAPVLDADTDSGTPWVATGYVAGPTLQETVTGLYGPLPERSVLALAAGLAGALREVHGRDVIHRDLKPSNVMLTLDGPRVIDFGIARATDGSVITRTGMAVGTPGFMSPEQARGEPVTPAADVFSLGAVLAFAATGRQPFDTGEGGAAALLYRVVNEPPALDGVPGDLRGLVERCLAKDPAGRPSPAEIAAAVEAPDAAGSWLPAEVVEVVGRRAVELLELERGDEPPVPDGARPSGSANAPSTAPLAGSPPFTAPHGYGPAASLPSVPSGPPRTSGIGRGAAMVLVMVGVAALSFALFFVLAVRGLGTGGGERAQETAASPTEPATPTEAASPTEPTWTGEPTRTAEPSATASSQSPLQPDETSSPTPAGEVGDVPEGFLGTWTWEGRDSDGPVSQRMVISQGSQEGQVMTVTTTDTDGYCEAVGELRDAAPHVIEVTVRGVRDVGGVSGCGSPTRHVFSLREDGTALYRGAGPSPRVYRKADG